MGGKTSTKTRDLYPKVSNLTVTHAVHKLLVDIATALPVLHSISNLVRGQRYVRRTATSHGPVRGCSCHLRTGRLGGSPHDNGAQNTVGRGPSNLDGVVFSPVFITASFGNTPPLSEVEIVDVDVLVPKFPVDLIPNG